MEDFVRVAVATPKIRVADCLYNASQVKLFIDQAENLGVQIIVLPELCLSGYTCGDLFLQDVLLKEAKEQLLSLKQYTTGKNVLLALGLPFLYLGKLYNVAAILQNGKLLGLIPKRFIPNYSEFYEARHFTRGLKKAVWIDLEGERVPFGSQILFQNEKNKELFLGVEICEDLWTMRPPSGDHAAAGATILLNLSASDELTGKQEYRRELVKNQSARLLAAYLYADAGEGESTTDLVFAGHNMIAENGVLLAESKLYQTGILIADLDIDRLLNERRRLSTFLTEQSEEYLIVPYTSRVEKKIGNSFELKRFIDKMPFVPAKAEDRAQRCEEIIEIQARGLCQRLRHTKCKTAVLGISGGLDSTLALLITRRAFDLLKQEAFGILAVTMPCFGTTNRTYQNAVRLISELGAEFLEIRINESVRRHLADIGHPLDLQDVTYENAQARERTQVLMDLANAKNALVIGTGDLSELALGFATYNGDHMSMYGVNASVPKTLVRHLVAYFASTAESETLRRTLQDILDTPVSPELLPPKEGDISQKTEEIVGPYELHDFFLYYVLRFGFSPRKILILAEAAFCGEYDRPTILRWMKMFFSRFFSQQFKRSCLPDGPKVGSVAVSPRGDLRMPSDASVAAWIREIESLLS